MRVYAPELWEPKKSRQTRKHEDELRDTKGIDPEILSADLGLQVRTICTIQRKLGIRACTDPNARRRRKGETKTRSND